ncbi:MAG: TlpA family protein disulfide reductase [Butyrivibrio sp.]|nr:TlpA family protein disulfide reductase [Acetatifactor muris]MCM1559123.1 TlpA family protein disulfide reductase [Butyrivibrio sp.]
MKKFYLTALLPVLMLCFMLTACGEEQQSEPVAEGDEYRDFTVVLADGSDFTLSDHEGSVILLNFWATWCGPCVGEMPAFPRLLEKYGDALTLIAVDLGEKADTVESFLERNGYDFPVALDTEGDIGSLYPSDGIPYTVLIGRDGRIAYIHLGASGADEMYESYCAEIDTLLEE